MSNVEFMTTARAEERSARSSCAQAAAKMKAALGFAHTGLGRFVLRARAGLTALGAVGAALLALYPIAIVLAIAVAVFVYSGSATPA